ncbi:MerR family transcriptional regulator [Acetobacter sacchari]|uniref:MerR family transcriptional regulator n=1 Tax=Acetobacter sacchari TaxID=2661687 RepID=A0ABS3LSX7_9PROT|nr:MerR family transcriptional regulator [Acetobacter sacchari]MBO1359011.1 MerR family transcriptional regulator [Acetobacter sacchari]
MLISEVARIAGLSKDGVRHYEEMGLIASTERRAGSRVYREYDPAVLTTIEKVRQAQRLGFSLKEIGPLLKAHGAANLTPEQTVVFLEERLDVIRGKLKVLHEVEAFIKTKLDHYKKEKLSRSDKKI